jgi:nucleoside-diphosphate-sugar epimerase
MKILILGGTGLISTSISSEFLRRGDDLTLYNRGQREVRIPPGAKIITGDRNDFAAFERQMAEAGTFDCVIDMICFTPDQAESDIRAFKGRCEHFIFCSTVNVYTKPADSYPILESHRREPINDDYGTKKAQCEDLFMEADARGDFHVTNIRPAQTYGEGGVIVHTFGWTTAFIDRLRKGKPVVVHGDGQTLWCACHVDDVGHAFVHAACNPAAYGNAYHTTGDSLMTWDQYHQRAAAAIGAPKPKIIHIPTDLLAKIAPKRAGITVNNFYGDNVFDNSAAKRDLDFRYTVSWEEGVRRTVAWLDAHNRIEDSEDDPFDDRIIAAWEKLSAGMEAELKGLED